MVVVDSQTYQHNYRLAHSLFTQRFGKDPKHRGLVDMPVFGHGDNHAGLQIADLLCSALLAPIACAVYGGRYAPWNTHCDSCYLDIRERFGQRLKDRTFVWHDVHGQACSSLTVSNPVTKRGAGLMWSVTATPTLSRRVSSVLGGRKPAASKARRPRAAKRRGA